MRTGDPGVLNVTNIRASQSSEELFWKKRVEQPGATTSAIRSKVLLRFASEVSKQLGIVPNGGQTVSTQFVHCSKQELA